MVPVICYKMSPTQGFTDAQSSLRTIFMSYESFMLHNH